MGMTPFASLADAIEWAESILYGDYLCHVLPKGTGVLPVMKSGLSS
jgi:hypothetical protein